MSKRKIIIHQRTNTRPIILHDESDNDYDELEKQLIQCFSNNTVQIFKTKKDTLIIRPSEILSIIISEDNKGDFYRSELNKESDK